MKIGFHPVFDNPVRMGYVPGWTTSDILVERFGDICGELKQDCFME